MLPRRDGSELMKDAGLVGARGSLVLITLDERGPNVMMARGHVWTGFRAGSPSDVDDRARVREAVENEAWDFVGLRGAAGVGG